MLPSPATDSGKARALVWAGSQSVAKPNPIW
jgi:hypothetical protein